jgi:hypothetical protein
VLLTVAVFPSFCCLAGVGASVLLADLVYDVPANVILDSARRALSGYDVITSCVKAWVFGLIISTVSKTRLVFWEGWGKQCVNAVMLSTQAYCACGSSGSACTSRVKWKLAM